KLDIEAADYFVLNDATSINHASFTVLLTGGANVSNIVDVNIEIYRVFPKDSNVGRTSGPPTFSTPEVPTRVNSPSDVAFLERSLAGNELSLTTATLTGSFTASNSVLNGINPKPNQTTGGEGPGSGQEVIFGIDFA